MKKVMFNVSVVALLLITAGLVAQSKAPQQKAPEPEKKIQLELYVSEVQLVLDRLQDGKYSEVGPVINKILQQARPQLDSTNQKK